MDRLVDLLAAAGPPSLSLTNALLGGAAAYLLTHKGKSLFGFAPINTDNLTWTRGYGAAALMSLPMIWCNNQLTFSSSAFLGVDALLTGTILFHIVFWSYNDLMSVNGKERVKVDNRVAQTVPALALAAFSYLKAVYLAPHVIAADLGFGTRMGIHFLSLFVIIFMVFVPAGRPPNDYDHIGTFRKKSVYAKILVKAFVLATIKAAVVEPLMISDPKGNLGAISLGVLGITITTLLLGLCNMKWA